MAAFVVYFSIELQQLAIGYDLDAMLGIRPVSNLKNDLFQNARLHCEPYSCERYAQDLPEKYVQKLPMENVFK